MRAHKSPKNYEHVFLVIKSGTSRLLWRHRREKKWFFCIFLHFESPKLLSKHRGVDRWAPGHHAYLLGHFLQFIHISMVSFHLEKLSTQFTNISSRLKGASTHSKDLSTVFEDLSTCLVDLRFFQFCGNKFCRKKNSWTVFSTIFFHKNGKNWKSEQQVMCQIVLVSV